MDWLVEVGKIIFYGVVGYFVGIFTNRHKERGKQKREKERKEKEDKKEDERLLREVRKVLLEIERMWKSQIAARPLIDCMDELSQLSAEIKREENKVIKTDIWQFSKRHRLSPSHGPASKDMRRELEELKKKFEEILGIVEIQGEEK